jgi:hypothetical protein
MFHSHIFILDKSVNIGKYTPENSPDSYPNNQICPFSMTSSFVAHGTEKFLGMLLGIDFINAKLEPLVNCFLVLSGHVIIYEVFKINFEFEPRA